ncbi:MAG: tRNA epoxyqueuosine(34) reductase QueG [Verrucomicrobia bacterium]|nr:tRNA epoxyqueuosine(34) reductase QueG [Verrucomicrobiota bacterium]
MAARRGGFCPGAGFTLMDPRQEELRRRLGALGFDDVRFVALTAGHDDGLRAWLAAGMHGEMGWMERSLEKRADPQFVLPGARSAIMLGVSYAGAAEPREGRPAWARYALHEDYHDTMKPGLVAAGKLIEELYGAGERDYRYYVDTGPVLERGWAARAGLGFVGKNAMLISRRHGNWLFLAELLTKVDFVPDEPIKKSVENLDTQQAGGVGLLCGKCTRCLDACPTDAFARPGVVDARRCVSYQTIENKGIIPRGLRAGIGHRIYGCDACLEVCPWNRFAQAGRKLLLAARGEIAELELRELLELTPVRFAEVFRRTAIKRVKLGGLLRNACVVAGNSGDAELLPVLVRLAGTHELPLVRAHAVWAVYRLGGGAQLAAARAGEMDTAVLAEYAAEDGPATGA